LEEPVVDGEERHRLVDRQPLVDRGDRIVRHVDRLRYRGRTEFWQPGEVAAGGGRGRAGRRRRERTSGAGSLVEFRGRAIARTRGERYQYGKEYAPERGTASVEARHPSRVSSEHENSPVRLATPRGGRTGVRAAPPPAGPPAGWPGPGRVVPGQARPGPG